MATGSRRDEQRRQIWSGCQSVLGCGGVIAIGTLVYFAVGLPLVAAARPGQDVIVFLYPKTAQNGIFFCGLVGSLSFYLLLAAAKTTRGAVIVCAFFLAAAVLGGYWLYSRVAAMAFHESSVELRFVWPRPALRLNPEEIISADYEESVSPSDDAMFDYTLHLRTRRGHYESFVDGSLEDMQRTRRRIEEMQARRRGHGKMTNDQAPMTTEKNDQ
jgi:hypothetical protein